ncbi:MFS transporter [Parapedobacter lycopersici]|uniref:MFS transporter n=1 Tax=Parapedobacter lycopersici TaxID=1864939 RepID=UPI003340926E
MITAKIKNYRWYILVLLFVATTINYLDRQIIGLLKPILEAEFDWSETDFAYIVMAFTAAYAIGLLFFGWFVDKVGTKKGYSIIVGIWSLAGMLHAVARSAWGFGIARLGLGLGEAGNFPAGVKAVSEWFPKKEKALATGIFNSGTSIGVVVALLLVPWILSHYGWHEVFLITGALGFIWMIFWHFMYSAPDKNKWTTDEERELIRTGQEEGEVLEKVSIKWVKLFSFPQTWAFVVGKAFIDPIFWFFLFWLPAYFSSTFNLDLTKPSLELMIIYTSTTVGSIGGGYLSSLLIKRGWPTLKARKTVLLVFALCEISIILVQFASNMWMVVALISLAVAIHQAWATNVFTIASDLFPTQAVSSVVGIGGMAGAVGGILFPMLVGTLLDYYEGLGNITAGYNILFTVCGFTYLITFAIIHLLTRNPKRVKLEDIVSQ